MWESWDVKHQPPLILSLSEKVFTHFLEESEGNVFILHIRNTHLTPTVWPQVRCGVDVYIYRWYITRVKLPFTSFIPLRQIDTWTFTTGAEKATTRNSPELLFIIWFLRGLACYLQVQFLNAIWSDRKFLTRIKCGKNYMLVVGWWERDHFIRITRSTI